MPQQDSRYFGTSKIGCDQVEDYAKRSDVDIGATEK